MMIAMVKAKLLKYAKTEFAKNLKITGDAVLITTLLGLLTSPIISRIFSPEAYGAAGFYSNSLAILTTIGGLMLPTALVVVRSKRTFYHLVGGLKYLFRISFFISLIIVVTLRPFIQKLLGDDSDGMWMYLLPFGLLASQYLSFIGSLNIRGKEFKVNSKVQVTTSLISKPGSILAGWLTKGNYLVIILADLLSILPALWVQNRERFRRINAVKASFGSLKYVLQELRDYPLYMLPSNLISSLSLRGPFFIISSFYSVKLAGAYLFANTIIQIPMSVVGNIFSPVFLQKSAEIYHRNEKAKLKELTLATNYSLFFIGLLPFSFLTVFGKEAFTWVFGKQWVMAGVFAQYLSAYFLFRLASSPLSGLYRVANLEKQSLVTQVVLILGRIVPLLIGLYWFSFETAMVIFAFGSIFGYLFHFWQMARVAHVSFLKHSIIQGCLFLILIFLFSVLKISITKLWFIS